MPTMELAAVRQLCDDLLCAPRFAGLDDPCGIFLPAARPEASRLGLALEPWPGLEDWLERERIDTLFLHRPWNLSDEQRRFLDARGTSVLAYHLAFDERLTTGLNPALSQACGWGEPRVLGEKAGRPLGMACDVPADAPGGRSFAAQAERLSALFGGLEQVAPPADGPGVLVERAAVVGAMNDALVREAHKAGVTLYATGQWRQPARPAVRETGIGVVVIGHARSERWGLGTFARLLRARVADSGHDLAVVVA